MLPEGLLEDIKSYLNVEGDEEDAILSEVIKDGIEFIDGLSGMKLIYTETGRPRDILFDYCEQVYNAEFDKDEFTAKYADEILLITVKNYLDITWHDLANDNKLSGIISRGKRYLDKTAGAELDYIIEDKPRELLLDYCRYVRSNAMDEFQKNYQHELLSLQINQEIVEYEALVKLSELTIGTLELSPAFSSGTKVYTAETINNEDFIEARKAHPLANVNIFVDDIVIENGTAAIWSEGVNVITITITNGTSNTFYNVVVTKR